MSQTSYSNKPAIALPGLIADMAPRTIVSRANDEGAEIPFGRGVTRKADNTCDLPASTSDVFLGVAVHQHSLAVLSNSGVSGYADEESVAILTEGRIWVTALDAVTEGGAVYVSVSAAGAAGAKGVFSGADDSANAALIANAKWGSSADAGALAILELSGPNGALS